MIMIIWKRCDNYYQKKFNTNEVLQIVDDIDEFITIRPIIPNLTVEVDKLLENISGEMQQQPMHVIEMIIRLQKQIFNDRKTIFSIAEQKYRLIENVDPEKQKKIEIF